MYRLFLDTADLTAWQRWLPTGLFHGVTTNPTILKRSDEACTLENVARLAGLALDGGAAEFQAQAWGKTRARLLETGRALAAVDPRVVVKLPVTEEGVHAARALRDEGVRLTLTAVYAPHQVLTACALGADYAAPYYGRIGDLGRDADMVVADMQAIADGTRNAEDGTRLLVASLRTAADVARLAAMGCDTFTFSPTVAEEMFADGDTNAAAAVFEADAGPSSAFEDG